MKKCILLCLLLTISTGCKTYTSNSSSSNLISTSSSTKVISSSSIINSSIVEEEISIDYVVSKLNETNNKSYTLNYSFQGVDYNDVYVIDSYYYNDLYKQGEILIDLVSNTKYLYDFEISNKKLNITNQSYNALGSQGNTSLSKINFSNYDFSILKDKLTKDEKGIKLTDQEIINFFVEVINDSNSFDYIIFNKLNNDLIFEFYFQDQLFDGYSYRLVDVGTAKNEIINNYLNTFTKLDNTGSHASNTFKEDNVVIKGDIKYSNGTSFNNFESLENIKVKEQNVTKYKLESISKGVSYKQYFNNENNEIYKIGLDGKNNIIKTYTDMKEDEVYPISAKFLNDSYLINDEYLYLGSEANEVISSLLINSSSIIIDAWIKEIKFKITDNKIKSFSFTTLDTVLNEEYVFFKGEFSILNNGIIEEIKSLIPSSNDAKINELLNSLVDPSSNYKLVSDSYLDESKEEKLSGEKHIINYANGVYLDANYRVNNDASLSLQFANGYSLHNDKIYSFRYDVTIDKVDNVKETDYPSFKEAILSLTSEVLYIEDNKIKINSLVTDISKNVNLLEQGMLIDPSTVNFYFEENKINKITYKYGNSYTSSYVEASIYHNEGNIDENILTKLNEAYPKESEIKELYLKDSNDEYVLSIYQDLYDNGYGEYADYIPFIPGIESSIDIIWLSDYPEGYQYLISDSPKNYLINFKEALVNVYGYTKVNENEFKNRNKGLKINIKEDSGYQQFYFTII